MSGPSEPLSKVIFVVEVWGRCGRGCLMKWKLKFRSWWKVAFRWLSDRSQPPPPPPPPDGLWSVIVSAACDLLSSRWSGLSQTGLSRWSPSSGGGNESGLRLLLLSARSSTLFVSLIYLSGPPHLVWHDGSDTCNACVCVSQCVCSPMYHRTFCLTETAGKSIGPWFYWNWSPWILGLRLIGPSAAAETAKHLGVRYLPSSIYVHQISLDSSRS